MPDTPAAADRPFAIVTGGSNGIDRGGIADMLPDTVAAQVHRGMFEPGSANRRS